MSQSLVQLYVHIVFSTKHRKPFLRDNDFRDRTHRYLAGICKHLNSPPLVVGGVEDHVHLLCRFGKTITIADLTRDVKRDSSKWVKDRDPGCAARPRALLCNGFAVRARPSGLCVTMFAQPVS